MEVNKMEEVEFEIFQYVKTTELKKLRDMTTKVFSKVGTVKSRQRLIYDLLNALKTEDRKRFLWLILKNINNLKSENRNEASKLTKILSSQYIEYETPENFEKIAYTIVMGIMCSENIEAGGTNE